MTKKKIKPMSCPTPEPKAESCKNAHLVFPNLGVTFIQTFTLDSALQFKPEQNSRGFVRPFSKNKQVLENLWHNENSKQTSLVESYELEGFDFHFTYSGYDDTSDSDFNLQGHCAVKMDVFFGKTVSVTYRFNFRKDVCKTHKPFTIDRLIGFLDTYLYSERRSFSVPEDLDERASFEKFDSMMGSASIGLPLSEDGSPLDMNAVCKIEFNGEISCRKAMTEIQRRYKSFIVRNCTCIRPGTSRAVSKTVRCEAISPLDDDKYAFVSVPHNLQHIDENKDNLFSTQRNAPLKNGEVIEHIKRHHKKELMGLISMLQELWIDSNEELFESICGQDVTLNTDECAFIGDRVGICFVTYFRGNEIWEDHLMAGSEFDGVVWPECLMVLQFYLAQRMVVRNATRVLLQNAVSHTDRQNLSRIVSRNQDINFYLAQSMLQFDAVQYKFTFNAQMADSIANRLNIKAIKEQFEHHMSTVDKSVRNIKDSLSSSREIRMNVILGIVSIISAFQLFFVGTSMPFLSEYWNIESGSIGAILITLVAGVAVIVILILLVSAIKFIFPKRH